MGKANKADIWTPSRIQRKQHSIIQKRVWEKSKSFVFYTTKKADSRRRESNKLENSISSVFWIASSWVRLYLSRADKETWQLQHIVAMHLLLKRSAPESYFLNRIRYFEMLVRCEDTEKRENWAIRDGWEYSSLARIII